MRYRVLSILSILSCASLATAAAAADFGGPRHGSLKDTPSAVAFNWTGLYVGAHAGYGWGETDAATTLLLNGDTLDAHSTASNSFDSDGWLGGFQAGYNYQVGRWVLGVEADYSFSDIDGSFNYEPATGPQKLAGGDMDWLVTVRGRIGHTFDNVLLYGTAGLAIAEFGGFVDHYWSNGNPADHAAFSSTETGWTVGGGVEVALSQNQSLKGEYLYLRFDDVSGNMRSPIFGAGYEVDAENDVSLHTVRFGLNYRFGR